jgi:hypothetical protein
MRQLLLCGLLVASIGGCSMIPEPNSRWPRVEAVSPGMIQNQPLREYQVDVVDLLATALCSPGSYASDMRPVGCNTVTAEAFADTRSDTSSESRRAEVQRRQRRGDYSLYARYIALADAEQSTRARNSVVSQLVAASVHNCHLYMQSLRGGQVGARTTADLATSTFGVAGAGMEPVSTSRALSSPAALSTAWGASWDRNVYADQAAEMVADEIRKLRLTERAALEAKYVLPYADWPMAAALADVADFHNSCTMLRGVSLIQDAVLNRERSVRAVRLAAVQAREAGGGPEAIVAAVSGVAEAFLGVGDFDDDLRSSIGAGSAIGSRDLEPAMARGRACLNDLVKAEDGSRNDTAIVAGGPCEISAEHVWRDQFIAVVVAEASHSSPTTGTFRARALQGLQERRAAIEAGRALYADTLSRGVSMEWNWGMIERTLAPLTTAESADDEGAYGPAMMNRDPVIAALRRSYEGFLEDSADRDFALQGALSLARMLSGRAPRPDDAEQAAPVPPAPVDDAAGGDAAEPDQTPEPEPEATEPETGRT